MLEGVHLVPGWSATEYPGAFVVQCVVAIEDENLHRSHFWVRDHATEGLRPLEKYLDSLPQIREIQDYLVERARRHDVPVIVNDSLDRAIGDVLDLVLRRADQLVARSQVARLVSSTDVAWSRAKTSSRRCTGSRIPSSGWTSSSSASCTTSRSTARR